MVEALSHSLSLTTRAVSDWITKVKHLSASYLRTDSKQVLCTELKSTFLLSFLSRQCLWSPRGCWSPRTWVGRNFPADRRFNLLQEVPGQNLLPLEFHLWLHSTGCLLTGKQNKNVSSNGLYFSVHFKQYSWATCYAFWHVHVVVLLW